MTTRTPQELPEIPVTVVIPTYKRPEKLARCLESIRAQDYPARLIRVIAEEDIDREFAFGIWNRIIPTITEGIAVYLCDDVELDPGCIKAGVFALWSRWEDLDGVVGFNQRNIQGKAGTAQSAMGMIGAKFLDRFPERRPFCPDYARFHFDSELGHMARHIGRFHFEIKASLVHYHPAHHPDEMDETHHVVRDKVEQNEDGRLWKERRERGLWWGVDNELLGRQVGQYQ